MIHVRDTFYAQAVNFPPPDETKDEVLTDFPTHFCSVDTAIEL